uniref:Uncharacterized protein n=1 Tax=Kwoniella bestiolae CBS 10118 TaxID=1296100 RepID=A0A1B9GAI7_9TREE|nr:hypothetical protein I302_02881 [Kwoniella bestiolae CBS 10118]OCF28030.1 hypothetical protein I302_02881 [Kwoniella bestiolae CBS 10118]
MSESPPSSASSSSTTSLPRLPTPPSPIPSFRPRRPREGSTNTTRSYSHSSTRDLSDWEIEELEEIHRAGGKRRKRGEPTSPVKAVFCLYLIFQILTRSDELDIFPSSTTSIRQSHSPPSSMEVPSYPHLPYGFPPIPNPIPSALPPAQGTSWWRLFFGVLLYPVYLLVTLLTTPLPLLLNLLYLLARLLKVILYPVIVVLGALYGTFVAAPLGVVGGILEAFYPLVMFVGGLVGVGLFLGLSVGWVGRWVLDGILRWKNHRDSETSRRRIERRKEKEEKRQARLEFELERIHDRMIPKTPTISRSQGALSSRKPVLNIGTTNLRGTKKDERRVQELSSHGSGSGISRSGSGYGKRHSSSGSSSERLTTPSATTSSGTGKRDHKITTFDKTYTTGRKDGAGRERRLIFQDDLDRVGEPVVVGIRKRGMRETYTVQG